MMYKICGVIFLIILLYCIAPVYAFEVGLAVSFQRPTTLANGDILAADVLVGYYIYASQKPLPESIDTTTLVPRKTLAPTIAPLLRTTIRIKSKKKVNTMYYRVTAFIQQETQSKTSNQIILNYNFEITE